MTTKEFIELLMKADPSGNAYIRFPDGSIPCSAQVVPGYYDGPFSYINERNQWVRSINGIKLEIDTISPESMVDNFIENWNPYLESIDTLWDLVKTKFVLDESYVRGDNRKINDFFKSIKNYFDSSTERTIESYNKDLDEVIDLYKRGCRFIRKENVNLILYEGWEFINETNPTDRGSACSKYTYPIVWSGKFKAVPIDDYRIEFILIEK